MSCVLPVRKTMCGTCPFRDGSPYEYLRTDLAISAITESRIYHSTGSSAINEDTGVPDHLCRGARDLQLIMMRAKGFTESATDEAWNDAREKYGMERQEVKDP